ncbi:MAG: hypothetical protein F2737_08165 [Actinobacteria bacterium]|uniref:Unannotated protein n=1 Tax=freshwater metagenome TaxID=449393 RepID=A0A6J6YSX6_9ZZZZ|nr:hypothetical protein [Actinomycetota bacterium]
MLAAGLLHHKLRDHTLGVVVESAGFGPEGLPATPETVELLRRAQVDASSHVSRRASGDVVRLADLVIVAERQHVVRLVVEEGGDFGRIFTLPELRTRLNALGTLPVNDLATALGLLNEGRPRGGSYLQSGVAEVRDPTGGSSALWDQVWASIDDACTRVAAFVNRLQR